MKKVIFSIFILFISFSQTSAQEMPVKWKKYFEKHRETKKYYKNRLEKEGFWTDTIVIADSTIVSYISLRTGKIVQKHIIYNEDDCSKFESVNYYNKKELVVYKEYWSNSFPKNKNDFTIVYYERFEYDRKNRLKIHVFEISTPMTMKCTYIYKKRKRIPKRILKIEKLDFWK